MSTEVKVPQLPESVADATLVSWHKKQGDQVERDENLVDIETDKVVLEVPAPVAGVLSSVEVEDGATVTGGQVIGRIEAGEAPVAEVPVEEEKDEGPAEAAHSGPEPDSDEGDSDKLSPSVRRLVEEHGLDPAQMKGTGRHGRLTKSDVQAFIDGQGKQPRAKSAPAADGKSTEKAVGTTDGARTERRVPMTRMRARIAERMVEAQSTAAMLTSFNEADMSAVMALRKQYRDAFEKRHGMKLGFMSFFVKAACEALKSHPAVNASLDGSDIVYHDYCDIGIAVSVPRGLVVPILRNADLMGFAEVEQGIAALAEKGRDGSLTMEDLTGGTFTITNGGVFGSLVSTPILNMPQSAILGMHKIQERPVVVEGQVVVRPMMYLALTYDHRIIDGKDAVQFLVAIKDGLEDPTRLLLEV